MTQAEYNYIIRVVNENAFERKIFLDIRADIERSGLDIRQIPYEQYLRFRAEHCRNGTQTSMMQERGLDNRSFSEPPLIPESVRNVEEMQKKSRLSREEKRQILGTIVIGGLMIGAGFIIPSISLPIWGLAICVLAWGLKDYIPIPDDYDSDYVDRYFKTQEDARLHTRAMIHQAYMHSGELKILKEKINGRK